MTNSWSTHTHTHTPEEGRCVGCVIVGPQFQAALDPRQHLVIGELARVAGRAHVPLRLLVQQLQDLGVSGGTKVLLSWF